MTGKRSGKNRSKKIFVGILGVGEKRMKKRARKD